MTLEELLTNVDDPMEVDHDSVVAWHNRISWTERHDTYGNAPSVVHVKGSSEARDALVKEFVKHIKAVQRLLE